MDKTACNFYANCFTCYGQVVHAHIDSNTINKEQSTKEMTETHINDKCVISRK